ncbi:phenoloxidase-activating factor 2-like [Chrysoperla carnea]|uniref:phenoloxidase-activating factor 2-like n=1 Tax=Chrysoperla carnea TaxID=189513 RepID=UPI001D092F99|nr:phenoloxidase-activating factor 2-like [Chrysoperla carnea]
MDNLSATIVCVLFIVIFQTSVALPLSERQKLIFEIFDFPQNETTTTCLPFYLCDSPIYGPISTINVRPSNTICPHYLEVPCNITYKKLKEEVLQPPPEPITQATSSSHSKSLLKCGKRNVDGINFKIKENGYESQFGEFPWMITVIKSVWLIDAVPPNRVTQCDGTLIHPQVVLTTAECVYGSRFNPSELKIRAGDWDTQTETEPSPYQERNVTKIIIHENYVEKTKKNATTLLSNNIALLVLNSSVNLNNYISTICLPTKEDIHFNNQNCIAVGWGPGAVNEGDDGKSQRILKKFSNRALSHSDCEEMILRKYPKVKHGLSAVCSESTTVINDTCWGNEGNILVCPQTNGQYVQIGLKSSNENCMEKIQIFGSLNPYVDWIQTKFNNLTLEVNNFYSDAKGSSFSIHVNFFNRKV